MRTNAFYDPNSLETAPPHFTVYDKAHKRFFVSNPYLNNIDVFDAQTETLLGEISVPQAWGIDISPLNGDLWAGTFIGDVYQVDTASLTVIQRYPSNTIGPSGFSATEAFVLADGRLALLGGQGGILGVDGAGPPAIWDPVLNTLDLGPNGSLCPISAFHIGAFAVSGDRTRVLAATIDEGGGGEPVCSYDPVARQAVTAAFPPATFVREIVPTPDGSRFFLTTNLNGVAVFDAKTLQLSGEIAPPANQTGPNTIPNAAAGAVISTDGSTLYLVDQLTGVVGAWDTTTLAQKGWVPSFTLNASQSAIVISAIDETGLIAGPTDHGVAFIDGSKLSINPLTTINFGFSTPAAGTASGGTNVSHFASIFGTTDATLSSIYVGNVAGAGSLAGNVFQVITPPSSISGAVDLTAVMSDGSVNVVPESFTYGPTVIEVLANGATAEGGQTGQIVGYGLTQASQITIGGQTAVVTGYYANPPISPYAFHTNALEFTFPPGQTNAAADLTLTTTTGSTTMSGAVRYVPATETYALDGTLQSGIYDPHQDVYYFTDTNQIQVLSRTQKKWLAPITLPSISKSTQLTAIAESPSGNWLVVSDRGGKTIYALNPAKPSNVQLFTPNIAGQAQTPIGVAVTDQGEVFYGTDDLDSYQCFNYFSILNGVFTSYGHFPDTLVFNGGDHDHIVQAPDGSRIYASIGGEAYWVNTADSVLHYAAGPASSDADTAISADGTTVFMGGYWNDSLLNPQTEPAYIDWETWFPAAVTGQRLNQDGSILFQPLTDGIDMLERNTGHLLYRIQFTGVASDVFDSLVTAPDNIIGVITSTGVSFVDVSSLPIPSGATIPFPKARVDSKQGNSPTPEKRTSKARSRGGNRPKLKRAHLVPGFVSTPACCAPERTRTPNHSQAFDRPPDSL